MHPKILKRRMEVAQDHTKLVDALISETLARLISTFEKYSDLFNGNDLIKYINLIVDQMNKTDADTMAGRQIRSQICTFFGASAPDLLNIALTLSRMADEIRNKEI